MTDMSAVFFSSSDNFSPRSRAAFDKNDRIQYTSARARGRRQGHGGKGTEKDRNRAEHITLSLSPVCFVP